MSTIHENLIELPFVVLEKIRKILKLVFCLLTSPFALTYYKVGEEVVIPLPQCHTEPYISILKFL